MNKFKVNDQVQVINQEDWAQQLVLHKVYIVEDIGRHVDGDFSIFVREGTNKWWVKENSFVLAGNGEGWDSP